MSATLSSETLAPPPPVVRSLLATLLAPHLLPAAGGDHARAAAAAQDIIGTDEARSPLDQIFIAQAAAFGLSALRTLSQAAADDLPPQEAEQLIVHADNLNRAANRSRRVAERDARPRTPPIRRPQVAKPAAAPHPAAPQPAQPAADTRAAWAAAIADVAAEFAAKVPDASPEGKANSIRAAALRSTANHLLGPRNPPA